MPDRRWTWCASTRPTSRRRRAEPARTRSRCSESRICSRSRPGWGGGTGRWWSTPRSTRRWSATGPSRTSTATDRHLTAGAPVAGRRSRSGAGFRLRAGAPPGGPDELDQLGAVADVGLGEDSLEVLLDGVLTDEGVLGDLFRGQALADQFGDVLLALGQHVPHRKPLGLGVGAGEDERHRGVVVVGEAVGLHDQLLVGGVVAHAPGVNTLAVQAELRHGRGDALVHGVAGRPAETGLLARAAVAEEHLCVEVGHHDRLGYPVEGAFKHARAPAGVLEPQRPLGRQTELL